MNLYTEEVMLLASQWLSDELAFHERDMMTQSEPTDFLTSVNSFDLTLKEVIADVQAAEASDPLSSPRNPRGDETRIRISNTCNGDSRGAHWFTVAYSISPRAAAPPGPQPQQLLECLRHGLSPTQHQRGRQVCVWQHRQV